MRWDRTRGRPEPIAALNRVRLMESSDPLVRIEEVAPSVRIGRAQTIPYCRRCVALMAEDAARCLPAGTYLAVTDAWRPLDRQRRIYDWLYACAHEAFPLASRATQRRRLNRWAAPYDQPAPPGHCTGSAIDVMLVDESGEPLDVTSPFERFSAAPTYVFGLSERAAANRDLLVESMLAAGFSNCRDEHWHYSYGDAGWAVRLGLDSCFHGLVELPPHIYEEQERLWVEAMKERPNPFLPPK